MKNIVCLLILIFPVICSSQTAVRLNIFHKLGSMDFGYYSPSQNNMPNGNFKLSRMEYYLSNFSIIHDGGQIISLSDSLVSLVKAGQPTSILLGEHNVSSVEGIQFYVGVPKNFNHGDPALWSTGSPLSYQAPSMHWGWIAGYQFVALEGLTGSAMNQLTEIHSFGDDNYFQTTVLAPGTLYNGSYQMNIEADYNRAIENIDISSGLIVHGDFLQANQVLENFNNYVFKPSSSLAEIAEEEKSKITIFPNPANGQFSIETNPEFQGNLVRIYSSNGQFLKSYKLDKGHNFLQIEVDQTGILLLEFFDNKKKLFSKSVVNN